MIRLSELKIPLAAVQQHQPRLLQDLAPSAQRDAAVTLAMMQTDAAEDVDADDSSLCKRHFTLSR